MRSGNDDASLNTMTDASRARRQGNRGCRLSLARGRQVCQSRSSQRRGGLVLRAAD